MRNSNCRRGGAEAFAAAALAIALATLVASCGGPYTPKRLNVGGDKLALADQLFAQREFGHAALEYKDFLVTFAGDERNDYAQFRLAESYRMDEEYPLAESEYRILINDYGYSEYVDDAFFLEGLCAFRQTQRVERDQTKSHEALDRLNRFVQLFPSSPRIEEARAAIREVHDRLGEKDFQNGKLYFSRKRYDAALVYLSKVIDLYPETVWAARCRYYRGQIRELAGEWTLAAEDYREAIAAAGAFPEKAQAQKRLGLVEARGGGAKKGDDS